MYDRKEMFSSIPYCKCYIPGSQPIKRSDNLAATAFFLAYFKSLNYPTLVLRYYLCCLNDIA